MIHILFIILALVSQVRFVAADEKVDLVAIYPYPCTGSVPQQVEFDNKNSLRGELWCKDGLKRGFVEKNGTLEVLGDDTYSLAPSPNGLIFMQSGVPMLKIGETLKSLSAELPAVERVLATPDQSKLVAYTIPGSLRIIDANDRTKSKDYALGAQGFQLRGVCNHAAILTGRGGPQSGKILVTDLKDGRGRWIENLTDFTPYIVSSDCKITGIRGGKESELLTIDRNGKEIATIALPKTSDGAYLMPMQASDRYVVGSVSERNGKPIIGFIADLKGEISFISAAKFSSREYKVLSVLSSRGSHVALQVQDTVSGSESLGVMKIRK